MSYSEKCSNLTTYYDKVKDICVPCDMQWIKPGREFSPNCGYVDNGGRREGRTRSCAKNSYNDGHRGKCQTCSSCPTLTQTVRNCTEETDTECVKGEGFGEVLVSKDVTVYSGPPLQPSHALWMAPIVLLACIMVGALSYFIYKRKKECFKGPQVQAAPLRVVLDDLDVLEELIILLDPEGNGVKCTRHLASYCSFPSTWINYTYSMRDSKSPLKTVLEGVTTKNPDWTVGHLARLLGEMGRTDAVVVLAKLRPSVCAV